MKKHIIFLILSFFTFQANCQLQYAGNDFWFGIGYSSVTSPYVRIFSDVATIGTITSGSWSETFCFNANEHLDIQIPSTVVMSNSNMIESKGIHIVTDNDVIVHLESNAGVDSDKETFLPTSELSLVHTINFPKSIGFWDPTFITIVATENATSITINNTDDYGTSSNSITSGAGMSITLNQGEAIRIECGRDVSTGPDSGLDISGTQIIADKPIFVDGFSSTRLPGSWSISYTDAIRYQFIPDNNYGNDYFLIPAQASRDYYCKITNLGTSNSILIDGVPFLTLAAFETFDTIFTTPHQITGSQDFSCMLGSLGLDYDMSLRGDPSGLLLFPISGYKTAYHDFKTPSKTCAGCAYNDLDSATYVIISSTAGIAGIQIDGITVSPSIFTPIASSGYSIARVGDLTDGFHSFTSSSPFYAFKWNVNIASADAWQTMQNLGTLTNTPNGTVYDSLCSNIVLPVELVAFGGEVTKKGNLLKWTTVSELNNDYFELQRSSEDAIFETTAIIKGNGTTNTTSQYTYLDEHANVPYHYYRLKQVDYNGNSQLSDEIYLEALPSDDLEIYPNPANEEVVISTGRDLKKPIQIAVYNSIGALVLIKEITSYNLRHHLNISELSSGYYLVKVLSASNQVTGKFINR
ncbi:MAG: hypothetical protein ACJA0U_001409 [Salibacteraceae bacterium]|jgi:hypothetical protein